MQDQKNFLIAVLLCVLIWLGFDRWMHPQASSSINTTRVQPALPPSDAIVQTLSSLTAEGPNVVLENDHVKATIRLKGALVNSWILKDYHTTVAADSPSVEVLSCNPKAYVATFRWFQKGSPSIELPNDNTPWEVVDTPKTNSVSLKWRNPQNIEFQLHFELDKQYLLTVKQSAINHSDHLIRLGFDNQLIRQGPVKTDGHMMLYEGPLGVFRGKLKEVSYEELDKMTCTSNLLGEEVQSPIGWMGITDKYWLAAMQIQDHSGLEEYQQHFCHESDPLIYRVQNRMLYLSHFCNTERPNTNGAMLQGESMGLSTFLFVGPKKLSILDYYEKKIHAQNLDLAVDFGWFYFLTKPMLILLTWLKQYCGNFGMAILLMTVLIKLIFLPLSWRSYRAMAQMKKLQPQLQKIKEVYSSDKIKMNQEIMALYRKEKVNPVSGCLPMIVQIPVFFALYKVLFVSIEMRHAPFWGWIHDLSAPDPTSLFNGFGLFSWPLPDWMHIGLWPIMMGASMVLQQHMSMSTELDRHQRIMMNYVMPIVFTFMLAQFPVGLVIYWTWSNILTIAQQWVMMRSHRDRS